MNHIITAVLMVLAPISVLCAGISPDCLHCLSKANPVPAKLGCIKYGASTFCGTFRISDGFYKDCRKRFTPPPGLDDFRNCTLNYDCAASCVEVYHSQVEHQCLVSIRLNDPDYEKLTCLDYGKMHANGIHSCGIDLSGSDFWQKYKRNMTDNCGCKVVYGSCATTMQVPSSTTPSGPTTEQLILYTVPAACGVILIAIIILCAVRLRGYAKRKRQIAESENGRAQFYAKKQMELATNQVAQKSSNDLLESQYNPYTVNPRHGGQTLPTAVSNQDSKKYITPSGDLPTVLVTSPHDSSSQSTLPVRHLESEKNSDVNYIYCEALPANQGSGEEDWGVTTSNELSHPPDYINSADVADNFNPLYINDNYQVSLYDENQRQESLRAKVPLPTPRVTNT